MVPAHHALRRRAAGRSGRARALAGQGAADQENWIGRSRGAELTFAFDGREGGIPVYTTRPDTLFGASFLAIAPDHPLAEELAAASSEVRDFLAKCRRGGTSEAEMEFG